MKRKLAIAAIALLVVAVGGYWLISGAPGERWARARFVERLEQMTGGRVELRKFRWSLRNMEVAVEGLTIHGLEPAGELPWLRAHRLQAHLDVISLPRRQVGLRSLVIQRPVIHLVIHPDGSSNQPRLGGGAGIGELFDLAVERLELRNGELIVNERALPLDLRAEQMHAELAYVGGNKYRGTIEAADVGWRYGKLAADRSSGRLQFTLAPQQAVIESAEWSWGQSRLQAAGKLINFSDPQLALEYKAKLDLAQWVRSSDLKSLRGGSMELNGTASYVRRQLTTRGKLAARNLRWSGPDMRVDNINLGAEYFIGPDDASFPHVFASMLGGTVTGAVEVRNWSGAESGRVQQGRANLRMNGAAVAEIARSVATRELPLDQLNLRGRASGPIEITWSDTPSAALARFDMQLEPPADNADPHTLPIAGNARGTYAFASRLLHMDSLELTGPALHLTATGTLAARDSRLQVTLRTSNLADVAPLVSALAPRYRLPAGLAGEASFTGSVTGNLAAPDIDGRVEGARLSLPLPSLPGAQPRSPTRPERWVQFDSASAQLRLSQDLLSLTSADLRRGDARINLQLRAGLHQGEFVASSPLDARLEIQNASVADLQALLGRQYPVSGTLNGNMQVSGAWGDPRGSGQIRLTQAELFGEPIQALQAAVLLRNRELRLDRLAVAHNGAQLNGALAYNWSTRAYDLNLRGTNFELSRIRRAQGNRFSLSGQLDFALRGSGTLERPSISGNARVLSLAVNGENLGGITLEGVTCQGTLHVLAKSQFATGEFTMNGTVGLGGDFPARLDLNLQRVDVDALLVQVLKGNITGHSSAQGNVRLEGPLRNPALLAVSGTLDQLTASLAGIRVANGAPIEFAVEHGVLTLKQFKLVGAGTELTASGTADLNGARRLDLNARGQLNLSLLQSVDPQIQSSGMANLALEIGGTVLNPDLRGTVKIENGAITHLDLPNGLGDINGTLVFDQDRMEVESLTARSGGGDVRIGGFVNFGRQLAFNLTAKGKEVRLRYPQGLSSILNADLRLTGATASATLSGEVVVTRFSMTPQFDAASYLARLKQAPQPNPRSPLSRLRLNLRIASTPELQLQSSLAKLSGDVDLEVRGTADRPIVLGRVNVAEGEVTFNGARYEVNHADISFSNPVRTEPVFDAEMTTRVREYDVTLNFHGPLDRLSTTYRSEPPLPTADIVGLLAFGQTRPESAQVTQPSTTFTETASQAILGQALNAALSNRMQKLFGVSRIRFSPPETVGTESNPSARVTIEQQVSRNITVTYVTNLSQSSQQVIQMEYNVNRNVSVLATRDQNGVVSFDVRLRQRKK